MCQLCAANRRDKQDAAGSTLYLWTSWAVVGKSVLACQAQTSVAHQPQCYRVRVGVGTVLARRPDRHKLVALGRTSTGRPRS